MFPKTRKIVFVSGTGLADAAFEVEAKRAFELWGDKLEFKYTSDLSVEEMMQLVGTLPQRSIVIYCNVFSDRTGRTFTPLEVGKRVAEAANSPVFCLWDTLMGTGVVGGSLLSFEAEGAYAAHVALDVLNGKMILSKPVTTLPTGKTLMLDWRQLRRWGISERTLPKGSTVINREPTFWDFIYYIIGVGIFFLAESALIIFFIVQRRRKKVAEESLRKAEEKYRGIFEGALEGFFETSPEGHLLTVNPALAKILGYDSPEDATTTIRDVATQVWAEPDERSRCMQLLEREGAVLSYQCRFRRKDGKPIWVSMNVRRVCDPDGRTSHLSGSLEDITGRKQADQSLRASEAKFRAIVENSHDGIIFADAKGIILYRSPSHRLIDGYTDEERIGNSLFETVHPDDLAAVRRGWTAVMSHADTVQQIQYRIRHKDGTWRWVETFAQNLLGNPNVEVVILTSRDITERKRVEEALGDSEEQYRSLLTNSTDMIFIAQDQVIKFRNPLMTLTLGYSEEELTAFPFAKIIHPEDRAMVEERHQKRLRGEEVLNTYSFRILTKQERVLWVQLNPTPVTWEGRPAVLCSLRDITSQKLLEMQYLQSQKMEAIGRLAGGIAHDFNNLLTVIKGYSHLALIDLKEGDPLKGNLEEIENAAERAARLTRQILAFSRRQIMEMKVLDLNSVLYDLDKMLRRVIGEDIELVTLVAEDLGKVKTDSGQIEQVIVNLAVNARDAMPEGGKLTIETANVELDEAYAGRHIAVKPGRYAMLAVSDTGCGMSPEVQEEIFEPFFTTKEKGKGTGLGLSTVYGIVKQSGGNIWVYSELGQGTTFKIYLPLADELLVEETTEQPIMKTTHGGETILLVEDDENVRKLTSLILRKQGYRVFEASNGEEAMATSRNLNKPVHLVLTDVVMPGMNGHKVIEKLRQEHGAFKVLYMSGYTDNAIVHHGILAAGTNFIQKPFSRETLIRKVIEALDK